MRKQVTFYVNGELRVGRILGTSHTYTVRRGDKHKLYRVLCGREVETVHARQNKVRVG